MSQIFDFWDIFGATFNEKSLTECSVRDFGVEDEIAPEEYIGRVKSVIDDGRAAIVYSLVGSCKALEVVPREWMEDILLRIPGNENNRVALRELLPDRWQSPTSTN